MAAPAPAPAAPSRALLLCGLVKLPSAWQMAGILYTAPPPRRPHYWCAAPGGGWDNGSQSPCHVYRAVTGRGSHSPTLEPCQRFEFSDDAPVTVVTQWQLVCGRDLLVSVSQFFYLLGILVGGLLSALLLRRFSPRPLLLAGVLVQVAAGVGAALSPPLELHMMMRFVTAGACALMFTAGYTICTGNAVGRRRLCAAAYYEVFWSAGVVSLPPISGLVADWRRLVLMTSLPSLLLVPLYRWIPDSPEWLPASQAVAVNGAALPTDRKLPGAAVSRLPWRRQVSVHVSWAATIVTYYGGLLNVRNLGSNLALNTVVAGAAEVAGTLLGLQLLLYSGGGGRGRWCALGLLNMGCGVGCLLSWLLPDDGVGVTAALAVAMAARVTTAASLCMLTAAYTQLGAVTVARVCLLAAPFIGSTGKYGRSVPLSAFGLLTLLGGLAALQLEDSPALLRLFAPTTPTDMSADMA